MNQSAHTAEYVAWYTASTTRGTFDIILSCTATLIFCVYTVLHLNVPWCYETVWARTLYAAQWIMMGIFVPEVVLAAAATQLSHAILIQRTVKERFGQGSFQRKYESSPDWQLEHSFFAIMGGYQLVHDSRNRLQDPEALRKPQCRRNMALRLEAEFLIDLVESDNNFDLITLNDLEDKSKTSTLAWILSLTQATWLVLQIIGRLISGLPITELEVNTVAHVLCALAMGLMWLRKPYDVVHPIEIDLKSALGGRITCRWLCQSGYEFDKFLGAVTLDGYNVTPDHSRPLITRVSALRDLLADVVVFQNIAATSTILEPYRNSSNPNFVFLVGHLVTEKQIQSLMEAYSGTFGSSCRGPIIICRHMTTDKFAYSLPFESIEQKSGARILKMHPWTFALLQRFYEGPDMYDILSNLSEDLEESRLPCSHNVFSSSKDMFSELEISEANPKGSTPLYIGLSLALPVIYGGMHLAFWNAHFPSTIERWMWRISSSLVCGTQPIVALVTLASVPIYRVFGDFRKRSYVNFCTPIRRFLKFIDDAANFGAIWTLSYLEFAFLIARIFLVIESFILLRSQPVEVYQQVRWTQLIPHIQ